MAATHRSRLQRTVLRRGAERVTGRLGDVGRDDARREVRALFDSRYPKVAEANRKREAHEAATDHSLKGWQVLLQYAAIDE